MPDPSWVGRGNGKLILAGEHAVVHGQPALAMAVSLGTTVRLSAQAGPTALQSGPEDGPPDPRLAAALAALLPADGLRVAADSALPTGRGMGSSAALCVALVRAEAARQGVALGAAEVAQRALAGDRAFHGNPSGVDTTVSAFGGLIRFQRGQPPARLAAPSGWSLVVLDSGVAGDTAQLVAGVTARRPGIDGALRRIGGLVNAAADCLDAPDALGALLSANHELLREIGVSTPALDELVAFALAHGALGAKLSGAGGGGVVIALVREAAGPKGEAALLDACLTAGLRAFACRVAPPEPE